MARYRVPLPSQTSISCSYSFRYPVEQFTLARSIIDLLHCSRTLDWSGDRAGNSALDTRGGGTGLLRRTLLGMSQVAIAEAIGLTFQQVQKYESGANRISSSRLLDLADFLDTSVSYFFEEMAASVAEQTPSKLWHDKALPDIDRENDPMARRETIELVRAFYRIPDPAIRKRLADLVSSVVKSQNG